MLRDIWGLHKTWVDPEDVLDEEDELEDFLEESTATNSTESAESVDEEKVQTKSKRSLRRARRQKQPWRRNFGRALVNYDEKEIFVKLEKNIPTQVASQEELVSIAA